MKEERRGGGGRGLANTAQERMGPVVHAPIKGV